MTLEQRESINATTGVFAKQKIEKMAIGLRGWKSRLVDIFDRRLLEEANEKRMNKVVSSLEKKDTFPKLLLHHAKASGDAPAYRQKNLGIWQTLTWAKAEETAELIALGLQSIGLKRDDKVAIIGQNTSSLYLCFAAVQAIGAVPVPLYPDSNAGELAEILKQSEIKGVICQDQEQVDKIEQLKDEVETNKHDITIIGGGGNKGIHQKLVQFIDSSVFVVKNYSVNKKYKILLPVNDSKGSDMAIETAINFAKSYKLNVEIVSVPEGKKSIEEVEKILKKTKEKFSKNRIKTTTKLIDGPAVNSIVNYAKDDSIVILGVSPKNPIMKYFFGSKPISIAAECNCPVLVAK